MNKLFGHIKTVLQHKHYVRQACFRMGLYRQGIMHDLSKFSPAEFIPGVKYFTGDRSPNTKERAELGYSLAWLHHQGRNKHHFEYWADYTGKVRGEKLPVQMPMRYLAEMVADRYAACRTYHKDSYHQADPLEYFQRGKDRIAMHPETKALLEKILTVMAKEGEEAAFKYTKELISREK